MAHFDDLFEQGQFRRAQKDFRGLFEQFPDELSAGEITVDLLRSFNSWGRASLYQGDINESLFRLERFYQKFDLAQLVPAQGAHTFPNFSRLAFRLGVSLDLYANTLFYVGRYDDGMVAAERAISFFDHYRENRNKAPAYLQESARSRVRVIRGKLHWKRGDYHAAITDYLDSIEPVAEANDREKRVYMLGRVFCLLAQVFLDIGDTDLAIALLNKSEQAYDRSELAPNHLYRAVTKNIRGRALARHAIEQQNGTAQVQSLEEAEQLLEAAQAMLGDCLGMDQPHRYKASVVGNLARLAEKKMMRQQRLGKAAPQAHAKALDGWELEVKFRKHTFASFNAQHPTIAATYLRRACFSLKTGQLEPALTDTQAAIYIFCERCELEDWRTHPHFEVTNSSRTPEILRAFTLKAQILQKWLQIHRKDEKALHLAIATVDAGIKIFESLEKEVSPEAMQLYYRPLGRKLAELRLFFYLNEWQRRYRAESKIPAAEQEKIFSAFQFAKHLNNYQQLWAEKGYEFPEASHTFSTASRYFQAAKDCVRKILKQKDAVNTETWLDGVRQALNNLRKNRAELSVIYEQIQAKADYLWTSSTDRQETNGLHLAQIREHFNDQEGGLIISYLLTSEHLFAMVVSSLHKELMVFTDLAQRKKSATHFINNLEENITRLSKLMDLPKATHPGLRRRHFMDDSSRFDHSPLIDFTQLGSYNYKIYLCASSIYEALFAPLTFPKLRSGLRRIYFMPDGVLHFLNFGLLCPPLTAQEAIERHGKLSFGELAFLGGRYAIAVSPSSSVLFKNHRADTEFSVKRIEQTFSLVVPGIMGEQGILQTCEETPKVHDTRKFLKELGHDMTCLPSADAKDYQLEDIANFYRKACVSHLHVHSIPTTINGKQELVFVIKPQDTVSEKVPSAQVAPGTYQHTILTQDQIRDKFVCQQQELLLLTACRARWGEINQLGQILSPLEAFLAAGSKNIVFNLYRIGATDTERLFSEVLQHLLSGHSLGEAMRKVKAAYLAHETSCHPIFWAASMLTGNLDIRLQAA